jgi:hypothetical protein
VLARWGVDQVYLHRHDWRYFGPIITGEPGNDPFPLLLIFGTGVVFLAFVALGLVATARVKLLRPAAAYVVLFVAYRVFLLPHVYFEWYLPPFQALCALFAAAGLTLLSKRLPRGAAALSVALGLVLAMHFPWTCVLEGEIQRRFEDSTRRPLGLFLARVVPQGEPVMSESAGYVGYYSNVLLWDYPGLTSPTVRQALASLPRGHESRSLYHAAELLQPRWLVMRSWEFGQFQAIYHATALRYRAVKMFTAPGDGPIEWCGLRSDLALFNRQFLVLRRED